MAPAVTIRHILDTVEVIFIYKEKDVELLLISNLKFGVSTKTNNLVQWCLTNNLGTFEINNSQQNNIFLTKV